jgi:hypothetical protein
MVGFSQLDSLVLKHCHSAVEVALYLVPHVPLDARFAFGCEGSPTPSPAASRIAECLTPLGPVVKKYKPQAFWAGVNFWKIGVGGIKNRR